MMRGRNVVCGAVVLALGSSALAGPWTNPSGQGDSFTYSNGQDLNGLFGEPTVFGDIFLFTTGFLANSSNGGPAADLNDTVSFDVVVKPGLAFSTVTVSAFGSYAVTGDPLENQVDVTALLALDENGGPGRHFEDSLATDVPFPVNAGSGSFQGSAVVDVSTQFPSPHNSLHFSLRDRVLAVSGPGGTAEVNITFENLAIQFAAIPEPAGLSILAVGAGMLIRRRRRD